MRRFLFLAALFLPLSLLAQSKTDISGTWKLNAAKSDFGPLPPLESRTDTITQTPNGITDTVTEKTAEGPLDMLWNYRTDGTETTNKYRNQDVKSTAKWAGDTLVINSKLVYQEQDVTVDAKWSLSEDGKGLTAAIHYTSPMGEADQTLLFEKQTGTEPAKAAAPATATPAAAGAHPNFTGLWKLNVAKSDFGPLPPPDSRTDRVDHKDLVIKDSFTQKGGTGDANGDLAYTTDGKESINNIVGTEMKGTAAWEGSVLVFNLTLNIQGNDIGILNRWELSTDGKTLTQTAHITGPMGDLDQKMILEKQPD